jgi:hypothetical protein
MFRDAFDTQLNHWPYDRDNSHPTAHHGAAYRYLLYLWEQFGDGYIQDLSHHPANGLPSIDAALNVYNSNLTADMVFADWVLANALDVGEHSYDREDWDARRPTWYEATFYRYPMDVRSTVHPYATDYYRLENTHPFVIRFAGTTQARLLPASPHSGESCWWSNAAPNSDTRLVRSIDLSGLARATLRFWAWYDIQGEEDGAHLSASHDGGQTWKVLQSYSGQSGGWVEQQIDLNALAGAPLQIRFDYWTGSGAQGKGFLLDDLSIPELGLEDRCTEVGAWQAEGFVLAGEFIPVRWVVQAIDVYREGHSVQVDRLPLDERQTGQLEVSFRPLGGLLGSQGRGILAISALARGTTEPLSYHCEILRE